MRPRGGQLQDYENLLAQTHFGRLMRPHRMSSAAELIGYGTDQSLAEARHPLRGFGRSQTTLTQLAAELLCVKHQLR